MRVEVPDAGALGRPDAAARHPAIPGWHPAIGWLAAELAASPSVRRVLLFGSRARGDHGERSDIDLAVACPDRQAWLALGGLVEAAPTLLSIDLVRLEDADPALAARIAAEGVVLHERA